MTATRYFEHCFNKPATDASWYEKRNALELWVQDQVKSGEWTVLTNGRDANGDTAKGPGRRSKWQRIQEKGAEGIAKDASIAAHYGQANYSPQW